MKPEPVATMPDLPPVAPRAAPASPSLYAALSWSHHPRLDALANAIDEAVVASQAGPEALAAVAGLLEARLAGIRREVDARQYQRYQPVAYSCAPALRPPSSANDLPRAVPGSDGAQRFGLTPAEQRITEHLTAGLTLRDVAERTGVRTTTLRSQLQAIFDKTGVRRQSALVALVLRNPSGVANMGE